MVFCLNEPCYNDFFSTFLSPRGQVLFSTALNFMKKHSDFVVSLLLKDYYHKVDGLHQGSRPQSTKWTDPTRSKTYTSPQSGRTLPRVKTPVHKMDGPHQGSRPQPMKWIDHTRFSYLYKSTKWTDPTKGQDHSSPSERIR